MREDQHRFLTLLGQLPARLTAEQIGLAVDVGTTGDPVRLGWGCPKVEANEYYAKKKEWFSKSCNNFSLYMGNHVGFLGGICALTDVPGILRWDCVALQAHLRSIHAVTRRVVAAGSSGSPAAGGDDCSGFDPIF